MKYLFFLFLILILFTNILQAQVDLSKYYNSEAFKMSSTEYDEESDLSKFKEVNPEDVEGFYERGVNKMEEGLYTEAIQDFDEVIDLVDEYADAYYLRGVCLVEMDSLEQAKDDFNKAIEIIPVFSQAYTQLGLMYWKKDDIKEAKRYFDTAYELDETDLLPVFYKCNIALFHEKNLTKTKRLLNKVIKNDSTFSGAYFFKAAIKMAEGYRKQAIKNFDEAIRYNPEFTGAYLWRGFTYLLDERVLEAEEDFSMLIKLAPEDEDFWALRSFLRIEMSNYKGAVDDMVESVRLQDVDEDKYKGGRTSLSEKIDLKNALNYYANNEFHFSEELLDNLEMGLCLFLEERYDEALVSFEIAQKVDSTEAAPFFFGALIHEYQQDFDGAAIAYTKALKRDKDIYDAYKKRGMIYEQKNDFRRAYVDYSHLIRLKPDSKYGYKMRGALKLSNGDYIGATLEFNEAIKRDSADMDLYYNRGLAKEQIKNFDGAIQDFDKVLNKKSRDSETLFHKAFCNFQLGDTTNASILCDSSLNISSYNPLAQDLRGQIRCAQGRYHEGIFCYNKAISMNSSELSFVYHRAMAQIEVMNWQAAILDLDKLISAAPKFGEAFYRRALCNLKIDKKEEAIADLKEADKLGYKPATKELTKNLTL